MDMASLKPYLNVMTDKHDFDTFSQFWPYYLSEHAQPTTRLLHIIGTGISLVLVVLLLWTGDLRFLAGAVVAGYGLACIRICSLNGTARQRSDIPCGR